MAISAEAVKQLRDQTGVSMMECKKALEAASGDVQKALAILGERSLVSAAKKQDRALGAGTVASYVHNSAQVGAMLVLSCETDFVSKNEEFMALARDLAMQAAAMHPQNVQELMAQPFIKDDAKTVADLVAGATQKFGERVEVTKLDIFSVR